MGTRQHPVVVVVGGGKMGSAVVSGWLASDAVPADAIDAKDVIVVNPGEAKRVALAERYGVATVADVSEITRADVVVLAVKPQVMMGVLEDISRNPAFVHAASAPDEGVLFVSVAAGLATAKLQAALPKDARLVRVMPNTPLTVGQGATGVCAGATATAEDLDYVHALFSCLGTAVIVDESLMDVVGALSGSGPAYVAAMVESFAMQVLHAAWTPSSQSSLPCRPFTVRPSRYSKRGRALPMPAKQCAAPAVRPSLHWPPWTKRGLTRCSRRASKLLSNAI